MPIVMRTETSARDQVFSIFGLAFLCSGLYGPQHVISGPVKFLDLDKTAQPTRPTVTSTTEPVAPVVQLVTSKPSDTLGRAFEPN